MDAFFASVEQHDRPELRGRPVLVGSDRPRGVVSAASYEAREFGCHSALPMAVALRRCPDAVVVPVRGERYRDASEHVFRILRDTIPVVEPLSIDEAFLDLTGTERLLGDPRDALQALRARVREETGLTASVGLAPNKYLAKLASDLDKPDGFTVIEADEVVERLAPLPVTRIWGVGPSVAERFHRRGVQTIGDLQRVPEELLVRSFGRLGHRLHQLAFGRDDRPVVPDSQAKSLGQECTFETDLTDFDEVRQVLLAQTEQVARRLRRHGLMARGAAIKLRAPDFRTRTRSVTFRTATDLSDTLRTAVLALFERWCKTESHPVRLVGMRVERLTTAPDQLELFEDPEANRLRKLDHALDLIHERFGGSALHRGVRPSHEPVNESLRPPEPGDDPAE